MRLRIPAGAKIFLGALAVYGMCPPFTSFDSYWAVPTALSLLHHGNTVVDAYVASAPPASHYAVECVPPAGGAIRFDQANGCPGGHWYNFFPVAVPVLALPAVAAVNAGAPVLGAILRPTGVARVHPAIAAFLAGDLARGHILVELCCGALFGALAVWVFYRIARQFLAVRPAVWLALLFAFDTSEWWCPAAACASMPSRGCC